MATLQFRKKKNKKKNILAWSLTHRIAHSDHGRWCQEANRYVSGHPSMLATPWAQLIKNSLKIQRLWVSDDMLQCLDICFFVCASCMCNVFRIKTGVKLIENQQQNNKLKPHSFLQKKRISERQGSQAEQSNDGQHTSSCNEWALGCTTKNGRNLAKLHQMRPMEKLHIYKHEWLEFYGTIVPWKKCGFRIVIVHDVSFVPTPKSPFPHRWFPLGSAPDVGDPIGWHVDLKVFQPWGFQLVVHDKMVWNWG